MRRTSCTVANGKTHAEGVVNSPPKSITQTHRHTDTHVCTLLYKDRSLPLTILPLRKLSTINLIITFPECLVALAPQAGCLLDKLLLGCGGRAWPYFEGGFQNALKPGTVHISIALNSEVSGYAGVWIRESGTSCKCIVQCTFVPSNSSPLSGTG